MREVNPVANMPDDVSADTAVNPVDIRLAAMDLLARREHSLRELRDKLQRRFLDETIVEEQLSLLTAEGLQSDLRFAQSYARQRVSRGYGPVRLRAELRERGVSADDVVQAMAALEIDWCAVATEVLHRKFGSLEALDIREHARRARFMQHRGFNPEHYQRRHQD